MHRLRYKIGHIQKEQENTKKITKRACQLDSHTTYVRRYGVIPKYFSSEPRRYQMGITQYVNYLVPKNKLLMPKLFSFRCTIIFKQVTQIP